VPKPFVSCGGRGEDRRGREEVEFSEIRDETNALNNNNKIFTKKNLLD